jgi:predicted DNA binding CopG/RHH family protein
MNINSAIERLFDHLENDDVDKAVMTCLRISRHLKDHLYTAIFLQEFYSTRTDFLKVLRDDTSHMTDESQKKINDISLHYHLDLHTLDFSWGKAENGEENNVLSISVGEIKPEIEQLERSIDDLKLPQGMGEYDAAAFTDRYNERKINIRVKISALYTIKERIKSRCLNYAITIEKQLQAQAKSSEFLQDCQTLVNNYFKQHSDDVYKKLQKATQLLDSNQSEDNSLLLTQIRRALKSAADYFYPPQSKPVICSDGETRNFGDEQYLNRLQEFISSKIRKSSSKQLLQSEFEYLSVFARRLNSVASKGVHAEVTSVEAKQGLIGIYMLLHNIIIKIQ